MINMITTLIEALKEVGIYADEEIFNENSSFYDFLSSSLTFINFLIVLEEKLNTTIPDELINIEMLSSVKKFCEELEKLCKKT